MQLFLTALSQALVVLQNVTSNQNNSREIIPLNETIYHFNATDIDGNEVAMEKYRGKVTLILNVASY